MRFRSEIWVTRARWSRRRPDGWNDSRPLRSRKRSMKRDGDGTGAERHSGRRWKARARPPAKIRSPSRPRASSRRKSSGGAFIKDVIAHLSHPSLDTVSQDGGFGRSHGSGLLQCPVRSMNLATFSKIQPMNRTFRTMSLALVACLALGLSLFGAAASLPAQQSPAPGAGDPKLIILGFDGVDAKLTQKWMDEGKLPNLAKLRAAGTFAPLRSTIPSQTPVSWSTFSTGLNPGRHTIFDFLKRDPQTYRPTFAAFDQEKVPFLFGKKNPWVFGLAGGLLFLLLGYGLLRLFKQRTLIAGIGGAVLAVA